MVRFDKETRLQLLELYRTKHIGLEGNILKVVEYDKDDLEFNKYLDESKENDRDSRRKRLDITKQIQIQNTELKEAEKKNKQLMVDLQVALDEAKEAKDAAVEDLDTLQKRTQFELMGMIVKMALIVIGGVGLITTVMYLIALFNGWDTKLLETTWSNMFGILLTNSFSIIGTIMGVKYATEKKDEKK